MSVAPVGLVPLVKGVADDARRAAWLGLVDFYRSDDLTYASSIAYYALLSLFPFLLLAASLLGRASASAPDRGAVLEFVFLYFPSRSQVSPAFRAFVDVARELAPGPKPRAR